MCVICNEMVPGGYRTWAAEDGSGKGVQGNEALLSAAVASNKKSRLDVNKNLCILLLKDIQWSVCCRELQQVTLWWQSHMLSWPLQPDCPGADTITCGDQVQAAQAPSISQQCLAEHLWWPQHPRGIFNSTVPHTEPVPSCHMLPSQHQLGALSLCWESLYLLLCVMVVSASPMYGAALIQHWNFLGLPQGFLPIAYMVQGATRCPS